MTRYRCDGNRTNKYLSTDLIEIEVIIGVGISHHWVIWHYNSDCLDVLSSIASYNVNHGKIPFKINYIAPLAADVITDV